MARSLPVMTLLAALVVLQPAAATPPPGLLVKLGAVPKGAVLASAVPPGTKIRRQVTESGVYRVDVAEGEDLDKKMKEVAQWPGVVKVEKDGLIQACKVPDDPYYRSQYYLSAQSADWAWNATTGAKKRISVCVIDSGLDVNHVDIKANVAKPAGINAYSIDAAQWPNMKNDPLWYTKVSSNITDTYGHGTIVSGIVAAMTNNGVGMAGVAWQAKLVTCKIFGDGGDTRISAALPCFDYCRRRKARVWVGSWGTYQNSDILKDELKAALKPGGLLVAAAGNEAANTDLSPFYPAVWTTEIPGVMSVGAVDYRRALWRFTNRGAKTVDLFASGVQIYSTVPGDRYMSFDGTSVAGPMVAGAATLIASARNNRVRGPALKNMIKATVDVTDDVKDWCSSKGILNIGRAVYQGALRQCYPPDGCGVKKAQPSAAAVQQQQAGAGAAPAPGASPVVTQP